MTRSLVHLFLLVVHWLSQSRGHDVSCSDLFLPGEPNAQVSFPAIFGVRKRTNRTCGAISKIGFQHAVALIWAASSLNGDFTGNNESFIPGIKIGVDIYDDCVEDYLTAKHAGELVSIIKSTRACPVDDSPYVPHEPIAGIIGTEYSPTSTILANILRSTSVPVVGISATLPELGNKMKYPNFLRTVPSDTKQAQVIVQLAKYYNWSYIVAMHTDDSYGAQGMDEFRRLAAKERICISVEKTIGIESIDENLMTSFVRKTLLTMAIGKIGIVYFGVGNRFMDLLNTIKDNLWINASYLENMYWIGSEAVSPTVTLAKKLGEYRTKAILMAPPQLQIKSFEKYYFNFIKNPPDWVQGPWRSSLKELMTYEYGCTKYNFSVESLQGCEIESKVRFSGYLVAVLDAVYLLANTVKMMHSVLCSQPGMCDALRDHLQNGLLQEHDIEDLNYMAINPKFVPKDFVSQGRYLKNHTGDFQAVDQTMYSILSNVDGSFKKIGDYKADGVTIEHDYRNLVPESTCKSICKECAEVDSVRYLFKNATLILLGLYSIHSNSDGFACGGYREDSMSYMAMTAFLSAVEWLRKNTGEDFGYLVIDDCYNPLVANSMLVKILSGDKVIVDNTGAVFNPASVVVAVGAQSSPVTMASVIVLQRLNIPLISYSSSNHNLDNRITYPYFSRTLSSDRIQAKAIAMLLVELQATHVGAIVIHNSYGLELYKLFREIAEREGICVEAAFKITLETTNDEVVDILESYRSRNIKVVVTIAMDKIVTKMLDAINSQDDSFVFIGSEAWGPNTDLLAGSRGKKARGSLVLALPTYDVDYGLREHLMNIHPFGENANAWLREFWQEEFKCKLPGGFINTKDKYCNTSTTMGDLSTEDLGEKLNAPLTVHSTYATLSAGLAIHSLRRSGVKTPFDPKEITNSIMKVSLNEKDGTEFQPFLNTGNGKGGFKIFNIQKFGDRYKYVVVGEATGEGGISLDMDKVVFYEETGHVIKTVHSKCLNRIECSEVCKDNKAISSSTIKPNPDPVTVVKKTPVSGEVVSLAVICGLLVVIIIVIAVISCLFCKGRLSWNNSSKTNEHPTHGYVSTSFGSSIARFTNQHSGESVQPPVLPGRNKTETHIDGISNRTVSDIVTNNDNMFDVGNMSRPQHLPGDHKVLPMQWGNLRPDTSNLPPPKPHVNMRPSTSVSQKSSTSSESLSHVSSSSMPSTTRPKLLARHDDTTISETIPCVRQGSSPNFVGPVGTNVYGHDPDPSETETTQITQSPQIFFSNLDGNGVYNVGEIRSVDSVNGEHQGNNYWLVRTADGQLIPYENVAPFHRPLVLNAQLLNIPSPNTHIDMPHNSNPSFAMHVNPMNTSSHIDTQPHSVKFQGDYITAVDALPNSTKPKNTPVKTMTSLDQNPRDKVIRSVHGENTLAMVTPDDNTIRYNGNVVENIQGELPKPNQRPQNLKIDPENEKNHKSVHQTITHETSPVEQSKLSNSSPSHSQRSPQMRLSPEGIASKPHEFESQLSSNDATAPSEAKVKTTRSTEPTLSVPSSTAQPIPNVQTGSKSQSQPGISNGMLLRGYNSVGKKQPRVSDIPEADVESDSLV